MAETLTVALRVAEEAIDEAISKAEFETSSQEKQNEANYLREHRGELVEELAKTIVQKIISRRKTLAEMKTEYEQEWPLEHSTDLHHQAASSLKQQTGLWRSHSAFSLLDNDPPDLMQDPPQALKKEGGGLAMSTWKSVDRLDNAVLKSPDGNWIVLQSAQLSRPSLLTKRKSLVYSALERESGVVSAYEGMGSDNEAKPEPDSSWGAVLQEIHRKMTDSNFNPQEPRDRIPSPLTGGRGSRDELFSDSEGNWKPNKPLLALLKKKVPAEIRRPSSSRRTSIIDVNFNVDGEGEEEGEEEESDEAAEPEAGKVRRSRRKRKRESAFSVLDNSERDNHPSDAVTPDTLTSGATTPEPLDPVSDIAGQVANQMERELALKLQLIAGRVSDEDTGGARDTESDGQRTEEERQGSEDRSEDRSEDGGEDDERQWRMEIDLDEGRTEDEQREEEVDDEEMKYRLYRLVAQSRLTYFSSTDDELDKVCQSEGEWEDDKDEDTGEGEQEQREEKTDGLTYKICQLEKEVRANQFSSTEDELDRVGVTGEDKETGEEEEEEEDGRNEELAVKVCRLANQVNATQFSSTEDELDRAGRGEEEEEEEEAIDEETLWKEQAKKAVQAAQLRDLASLVSASPFHSSSSSSEHQLDGFGANGGEMEQEVNGGEAEGSLWEEEAGKRPERRESLGDLDVRMFDLKADIEEKEVDETLTTENILDSQTKGVEEDKTEVEEKESATEETEDESTARGDVWEEKVEVLTQEEAEKAKETEERQEMELETVVAAQRAEEIIALHETKVQQENQPEAKRPDKKEGEEGQWEEKIEESSESQGQWGTAADSDEEEDAEFDRIISSMLMMTLEDMQGEMLKGKAGENGRLSRGEAETDESLITGGESGFEDGAADAQSTNASEEKGESQSCCNNEMETAEKERPGENVTQEVGGDVSTAQKNGEATGGNGNVMIEETLGVKQTCGRTGVDDGGEEGRGGKLLTEGKVMETHGEAAEGETEEEEERLEEPKQENADDTERSGTSPLQEGLLSPEEIQMGSDMELYKTVQFISALLEQRYSAVSLRSITTEVLKVLNATEELLQGVEGGDDGRLTAASLPPNTDPKKLDQQFSRLEENVYVAAGTVYSLEAELSDLEECARGICSATSDMELSFLEEQVASAAAKVQQSELQICDISARIAALKNAGLNVDPQSRVTKTRTIPVMPVTLDSSRQQRRRLPAPPVKEDKET